MYIIYMYNICTLPALFCSHVTTAAQLTFEGFRFLKSIYIYTYHHVHKYDICITSSAALQSCRHSTLARSRARWDGGAFPRRQESGTYTYVYIYPKKSAPYSFLKSQLCSHFSKVSSVVFLLSKVSSVVFLQKSARFSKKNPPPRRDTFFDGYCSTVQGLLDWFEVDLGFTWAFI